MFFYAITGLINAVASTFLGFLVYLKNKKGNLNRTFTLFCLCVAIWSYAYFVWQISTIEETALFWSRALMVGAIFMPITYFHFITVFLNIHQKKKKLLILGYILSFIFLILNLTPLFVKNVELELFFPYWPKPGITFHPFLLMFFGYAIYSSYLLWRALRKSVGIEKLQIRYVLFGTLIGLLGGSTNYFLWYEIPIPPLGNGLVVVYIIFITLAILKYHLFEIKVILTELLVGVIGLLLLVQAVTAEGFTWQILGLGLFVLFCVFGYLLIKSVMLEIQRRQEIEKIDKAKSEFISIASHQLRTPLTAVKGYISMILEGTYGQLAEKQTRPLENVYQSNERLIRLVNDLLNLSRLDAGKIEFSPELTSLEEMVSGVVEELRINAEKKGLYMKMIKPSESLPKIMVDQDKLRQVILNIVDNAIKYTKEGGITLELKKLGEQEEIKISDTGEGMDEGELNSLFQMFSRATAGTQLHAEGAGLGLYVARQFIEMHGGKIWAESPGKGKGSAFIIQLPIKLDSKLIKEKTKIITKAPDDIF